jgi:Domain of unknown function (DUF309)
VHAPWAPAVAEHAGRALRARTAYGRRAPAADPIERAVRQATALWNESLFFEVHEVLEEVWRTVAGDLRQALQGVIQIGVAFHHLAHGNRRGARNLLAEGRERLGSVPPATLPALDAGALLAATEPWIATLADDTSPPPDPPRLGPRPDTDPR